MPTPRQIPLLLATLCSIALLSWAGHHMLGPVLAAGPTDQPVTVTASGGPIDLVAILADGEHLWLDDPALARRDGWGQTTGYLEELRYRAPGSPATLSLPPGAITLVVRRGPDQGTLTIARGGQPGRDIALSQARRETSCIDLPRRDPPIWTLALLALPLLLLALLLRPWHEQRTGDAWVVLHTALLHGMFLASQPILLTPDSPQYPTAIHEMWNWGISSYFPPGYGAFMAAAHAVPLPGHGLRITFLQAALLVGTSLLSYRALRRALPRTAAFVAVLLSFSTITSLKLGCGILSETPTVIGVLAGLAVAALGNPRRRLGHACAAGALVGLAATARGVPIVAGLCGFALIYLLERGKRSWVGFALASGTAIAVLAFPMTLAKKNEGRFTLTNATGEHMFNAVVQRSGLYDRTGPATREFLRLVGDDPAVLELKHLARRELLTAQGLDYNEAMRLQGEVASESMRAHPWAYLAATAQQALYQLTSWPKMTWTRMIDKPAPTLTTPPVLGVSGSAWHWRETMEQVEQAIWPYLVWLYGAGLLAALILIRDPLILSWYAFVPCLLIPTAAVELSYERYSMPVAPVLVGLAVIGPVAAITAIVARVRGKASG